MITSARAPGVHFEWVDRRAHRIGEPRTDVAGFVGIAQRGPLHRPVRVESWLQFTTRFGGHVPQGYLAYAVEGFFANGGQVCWVVRVADPRQATRASLSLQDGLGREALRLEAVDEGAWGAGIRASVVRNRIDRFNLTLEGPGGEREFWPDLTLAVSRLDLFASSGRPALRLTCFRPDLAQGRSPFRLEARVEGRPGGRFDLGLQAELAEPQLPDAPRPASERHADLSLDPADPRWAVAVLNRSSSLVVATALLPSEAVAGQTLLPVSAGPAGVFRPEARSVAQVLEGEESASNLVRAVLLSMPSDEAQTLALRNLVDARGWLAGGTDGLKTLSSAHFTGSGLDRWGLAALAEVDEVALVAAPDIMPKEFAAAPRRARRPRRCEAPEAPPEERPEPPGPPFPPPFDDTEILMLQEALLGHCAALGDRVAILDPGPFDARAEDALARRRLFDSSYGALYFPWLRVPDPLRLTGLLRAVPPSGHLAGVYARGDLAAGVHKPPANQVLEGVRDLTVEVDEITHGFLNEQGVNVIRPFPGRGLRVMGARTLASDAALRYVNVRRLLTWIAESIDEGVQWTAFEPNDPDLWGVVDREVRSLLEGLWRRGMLDGATREEAYSVQCDATTNPPDEVAAGRLICLLGVRPPWPAEFITVRIGRTESALEILGVEGASLG